MKKQNSLIKVALVISCVCAIIAFITMTLSPNNIVIGVSLYAIAIFLMIFSLVRLLKIREDRLTKLEKELEKLKDKLDKML